MYHLLKDLNQAQVENIIENLEKKLERFKFFNDADSINYYEHSLEWANVIYKERFSK